MDNVQSLLELGLLPLIGGILVGLSSTTMLGGLGRITGISGIVGGLFERPKRIDLWRYFFVAGLLIGGILMLQFRPDLLAYSLEAPLGRVVIAGLLVGFGTRLGGGCTSGHGVCGLARRTRRSTVATLTFIAAGMITVYVGGLLS